ncbi:hypothetical protein BN1804_00237 [Proteus penneri]|uniref:Uncharacterized protein n=1 Tax=Proteus penneri TaxID=102862 RepID=A0A0G4Q0A5_9GAMM|nr:hypothetical protein BN1804_00237 [Proteus penneri]
MWKLPKLLNLTIGLVKNFLIHTVQKMLLSMIRLSYSLLLIFDKKSGQFKKWIANGVIKDSDSKIIAIDIG